MNFLGIIPARYSSSRFPGKPLALIGGKPMIQCVYEKVSKCLKYVYVATDDQRIQAAVKSFGGNVVMTSTKHKSGTDRCLEASTKVNVDYDVIINIQGDEPFVDLSQIEAIKSCFDKKDVCLATLVKQFTKKEGFEALENPNSPKVILNKKGEALYFSRSIIPYCRNVDKKDWLEKGKFYKHIGIYAYKKETLKEISNLPESCLEKTESLEQLRWLENGYKIQTAITDVENIAVDTPEDLERINSSLK